MSFEIWPSQVIGSIESVNQTISNLSSSAITPVSPPISDFVGSSELAGKGYDGLKRHMDVEINSGLLNQCRLAISDLAQANAQHLNALSGISQYGYLNQTQLNDAIDSAGRMLSSVTSVPFPGAGLQAEFWRRELEYLNRKRIAFNTYLTSSTGLYDNLFTGLKDQMFRMEHAVFCRTNGTVTMLPPRTSIYMMEMLEFDNYGNPIFNWESIEELLSSYYTDGLSEAQFTALGAVFAYLLKAEDIKGVEQFLNAMAQPFTGTIPELGGPLPTREQLEGFYEPFLFLELWHVCSDLAGGIQDALRDRIGLWTVMEHMNNENDNRPILEKERHRLIQGYALLSLFGADSPMSGWSNVSLDGTSGNVFLGGPDGAGLNLSNIDGAFQLQFNPMASIVQAPEGIMLGDESPGLYLNWNDPHRPIIVDMPWPHTITIPQVLPAENMSAALHLFDNVHEQESAAHTPNYISQQWVNIFSFVIGEIPLVSTVIGAASLMHNQAEAISNTIQQDAGEYTNKILNSLDILQQAGWESINISYFHYDVVEIIDQSDNSMLITKPTPMTLDIWEHYAGRYQNQ